MDDAMKRQATSPAPRRAAAPSRARKQAAPANEELTSSGRGPAPEEDELYRIITEAIFTKALRPGNRLKESALAAQFGVSRARVRRVFQRLADLDIVEFRLNHGALVRRPGPAESRAVFATRRVLEAEAVRATVAEASDADVARLRRLLKEEQRAYAAPRGGLASLSSQFHLLLGELCRNPVLARILNQMVHQCVLIQSLYERDTQPTVCLIHDHEEIVDLIAARDADRAVAVMMAHIGHIEASLDYDKRPVLDDRLARTID
jgi:DNA-binding GntR family transcriptional regulator